MKSEEEIRKMINSIGEEWFGVDKNTDIEGFYVNRGWLEALKWVLEEGD